MLPDDFNATVRFRAVTARAPVDCGAGGGVGGGGVGGYGSPPWLAAVGWLSLSWYTFVMIVSAVGYIQL